MTTDTFTGYVDGARLDNTAPASTYWAFGTSNGYLRSIAAASSNGGEDCARGNIAGSAQSNYRLDFTASADHWAQATLSYINLVTNHSAFGPTVRHSADGSRYAAYAFTGTTGSNAYIQIVKGSGSTGSLITVAAGSPSTVLGRKLTAGDVVKLEVSGSPPTFVLSLNGLVINTVTETVETYASGAPGLVMSPNAAVENLEVGEWQGDYSSGASVAPLAMVNSATIATPSLWLPSNRKFTY